MAISPDVVVELVVGPLALSQAARDAIVNLVKDNFFPVNMSFPSPQSVLLPNANVSPSANVLTVGLWIEADGLTDDQRRDALAGSSFISGNRTAAIFVSAAMIRFRAELSWAAIAKHQGRLTLDNTIDVEISSTGIVTRVGGTFEVPLLPDIGFNYTTREALTLNPPGAIPPLRSQASTDLSVSQLGVIANSVIIALIEPILGGIVLIGGEVAAAVSNPNQAGAGASLAQSWPAVELTSSPFVGKVTFTWSELTLDTSGIRTLGDFQLGSRSPHVRITGPMAVSFPITHPSAVETYTFELTDLRPQNATVLWGGVAQGAGTVSQITFDAAGKFPIHVSVTDTDQVTAADQSTIIVTVTGVKGGGKVP